MHSRIHCPTLRDKVTDARTAAAHIQDGTNLFISGFTSGYPKLVPKELVRRARGGEQFKINLFAGASTGESVDGILAEAGVVAMRRPYMSDKTMRRRINDNLIRFKDDHLSMLAGQVRAGNWGAVDVAIVEAVAITEDGNLIPTMSVGNTPTYVKKASKVIIEITREPEDLFGLHDIFIPEDPPYRMPIPIYRVRRPDRQAVHRYGPGPGRGDPVQRGGGLLHRFHRTGPGRPPHRRAHPSFRPARDQEEAAARLTALAIGGRRCRQRRPGRLSRGRFLP